MKTTSRYAIWILLLLVVSFTYGVVLAEDGGDPAPQSVDCYYYYDLGDLPDGYGTSWNANGAAHRVVDTTNPAVRLGDYWDKDADGAPSDDALGDDTEGDWASDEDGVARVTPAAWAAGQDCDLTVKVKGDLNGTYTFAGWLDWNNDGDFDDAGEALELRNLSRDTHIVQMTCPGNFNTKVPLYARFRLYGGTRSSAYPTGTAYDGGEVEDYKWTFAPTAVTFTDVTASGSSLATGGLVAALGVVFAGAAGVPAWIDRKRTR